MVEIKPFKGITYDVLDLSNLISPPYDVIDKEMRKALIKKDICNFVNIILKDDSDEDYKEAGKLIAEWLKDGTLNKSEKDKFYLIKQQFDVGGQEYTRLGISCLVKADNYESGDVLPHEQTFPGIKADRLKLMEDTKTNTGQIFMIAEDSKGEVQRLFEKCSKKTPTKEAEDEECNLMIKLIEIDDEETINDIKEIIKDKSLIIADGHHRYGSSAMFAQKHKDMQGADKVMCYVVSSKDPGLVILPTNRLIHGLKGFNEAKMLEEAGKKFSVIELDNMQKYETVLEKSRDKRGICMYLPSKDKFFMLTPTADDDRLDVEVLHEDMIDGILGISKEEQMKKTNIEYVKGKIPTFEKLNSDEKEYQIAFFLNAPTIGDIWRVISDDRLMPQKSTFFYPKIYSGIVFRQIE